jgi:hypothetical protein
LLVDICWKIMTNDQRFLNVQNWTKSDEVHITPQTGRVFGSVKQKE